MFKLHISKIPGSFYDRIYLISEPGHRMGDVGCSIPFNDKEDVIEERIVRDGLQHDYKPFMIVDPDVTMQITQAFIDYGKSRGIEAESESRDKGRLESQTQHLEDMRKLVFKSK
jgi:hypothetical protein